MTQKDYNLQIINILKEVINYLDIGENTYANIRQDLLNIERELKLNESL